MSGISHSSIWMALDNLAHENHISVSRMAILSQVDATTFNKSKRIDTYGRLRWPSTETLAKVLNTMNVSWVEFGRFFPSDDK